MSKVKRETIDEQNKLTNARIRKILNTKTLLEFNDRPKQNLSDLMSWVKQNYGEFITQCKKEEIVPIINNIIGIEGAFVCFCEQKEAVITPLLIDSVASWNTPTDTEAFMIQGIFLISYKNLSFLHCALFHKGNQFEDEISYFILLDKHKYMDYIAFRNEFDEWQEKHINEVLEVKVFGGTSYEYEKNHYWKDLFLSKDLKNDIKFSIESFLSSQVKYEKHNLPWKRGFLLYGPQGNGKTTIIHTLISEYDLKPVTISSMDDESLFDAFEYAENNSPSLLFIEDIDACFADGTINIRTFLNMIDGLNAVNGIVLILTTNFPQKLPKNLIDRKSRIDKLWEISYPDKEMYYKYLRKWFNSSIVKADVLNSIVDLCIENSLSFSDLKEVYISTMFSTISVGKQKPTQEDIKNVVNVIIKEKKDINNGFTNMINNKKNKKFGFSKQ